MPPIKSTAEEATAAPPTTNPDSHANGGDLVKSTSAGSSTEEVAKDAPVHTEEASPPPDEKLPEIGEALPTPTQDAPPLPNEQPPPLPDEAPPEPTAEDDGWAPVWDATANAYYFYNRFTQVSQWENPRVPDSSIHTYTAMSHDRLGQNEPSTATKLPVAGGYNPAIHGDYDPNADYAILAQQEEEQHAYNPYTAAPAGLAGEESYAQQAAFNRFTGRFTNTDVHPTHTPDQHTDEAKSRRQMNAFFDVDAAANAHGGRSLRAERQARKITKKELEEFQQKRRAKKDGKRRAWLKD